MKLFLFLIGLCAQLHAPTASKSTPQAAVSPLEIVVGWEHYRGERRARIDASYGRITYLIEEKRVDWDSSQEMAVLELAWEELETLREESDKEAFARLRDLQQLEAIPNSKLQEEVAKQVKLLAIRYLCEQGKQKPAAYLRADVDLNEYQRREFVQYYQYWFKFRDQMGYHLNFDRLQMIWQNIRPSAISTFDELDKLVYEYAKTLNGYFFNYSDEEEKLKEWMRKIRGSSKDLAEINDLVEILANYNDRDLGGDCLFHELGSLIAEDYLFEKKNPEALVDKDNRTAWKKSSSSSLEGRWQALKDLRQRSDMATFAKLKALQKLQGVPNPKLQEEITKQLKLLTIRFLCEEGQRKPADYLRADVDLNEDERRKFVKYYELWFEFEACLKSDSARHGVNCGALMTMFHNLVRPSIQSTLGELDKLVYEYAQTVGGYVVDYSANFAKHLK
jgi:hypothetical protein